MEVLFHSHLDSPWQLCCCGMCKNLLRSDGQQRNYGKAKFPSNLNCGQKNVSEMGPCCKFEHGRAFSRLTYWPSQPYCLSVELLLGSAFHNTYDTLNVKINTLRLRQNGRHFADEIFRRTSFNEDIWILINVSLNFVPKGQINNIPALVQIIAWHQRGHKPLSKPVMVSLLTHICVTQPQWVKQQT